MNKALLLALNEHIYLQGLISREMKEKIDIQILSENLTKLLSGDEIECIIILSLLFQTEGRTGHERLSH